MRQRKLICTNPEGVTVGDIGGRHQPRRLEFGEVFPTNRWYEEKLLEKFPDGFAKWTPELEAELSKAKPRKRGRPKAAQDEGESEKAQKQSNNVEEKMSKNENHRKD